tara:strand:+ start:7 stop:942 length:936 start_codon:yes stop_codon:yes gene_type:complete
MWFTYLAMDEPCCVVFETSPINNNILPESIRIAPCCFHPSIAYGIGTLMCGTNHTIVLSNRLYFTIETIYSYKGEVVIREPWKTKFVYIHEFLSIMINIPVLSSSVNTQFLIIGLPLMAESLKQLFHEIRQNAVTYPIKHIQFIQLDMAHHQKNMYNNKGVCSFKHPQKEGGYKNSYNTGHNKLNEYHNRSECHKKDVPIQVFLVKPTETNDIYTLYGTDKTKQRTKIGTACIKTYESSVLMNSLFRTIKENENLDALEESDDEDDINLNNDDNFVHMDREYEMVCEYNNRFNKWCPVRLATEKEKEEFYL